MTARDRRGVPRKPREERRASLLAPLPGRVVCVTSARIQGYIIDHNLRRVLHRYVTGASFTSELSPGRRARGTSVPRKASADFTEGGFKSEKHSTR